MKTNRSHCPLTNALDIFGDKWSLIIIRDLFLGKKTFTEFMRSNEKIASNILTNRLEFLINHGLLEVTKLPNDNKTKIYYLTNKGIDMYPIMYEMMCWSNRNLGKEFGPNWKTNTNRHGGDYSRPIHWRKTIFLSQN
jgi:DNA-binding HxlR family transcriptional regulator